MKKKKKHLTPAISFISASRLRLHSGRIMFPYMLQFKIKSVISRGKKYYINAEQNLTAVSTSHLVLWLVSCFCCFSGTLQAKDPWQKTIKILEDLHSIAKQKCITCRVWSSKSRFNDRLLSIQFHFILVMTRIIVGKKGQNCIHYLTNPCNNCHGHLSGMFEAPLFPMTRWIFSVCW